MKVEEQRQRRRRWRPRWTPARNGPAKQAARPERSRVRRWTAAAVAVVVAVGAGWLAINKLRQPAEQVYIAEADAYVTTAHPDANYGATPTLRADATPRIRSYLRFRLFRLPGRVIRAELLLWSPTGTLVGYSVHPASAGRWVEGNITSSNGPAAGTSVSSSGPLGPGSWSRVDVTRLVEGREAVSLVLTTRSSQNITFDSREGSRKPQLIVRRM